MIPLVAPTITQKDRGYVSLRSVGDLLDDEREVRRFEEAFAERVNCVGAVAVCSGTVALELALEALDVRAVTLPTYGCVALRNAAQGCAIRFCDSMYEVRDATLVMAAPETRAVIVMHAFGHPTVHVADRNNDVIEDYTLSFGAIPELAGDLGVCSTHASKMISTGRGGVVFGNDCALLERVRELAYYDNVNPARHGAHSVGMSATQAAVGYSQLQQIDNFIERRRIIASRYNEAFTQAGIDCPTYGFFDNVWFRYLIRVESPAEAVGLLAEQGIEAGRGVYPLLHRQAGLDDARFPGAVRAVNSLLSVPVHPSITDEQAAHIIESVKAVCAP